MCSITDRKMKSELPVGLRPRVAMAIAHAVIRKQGLNFLTNLVILNTIYLMVGPCMRLCGGLVADQTLHEVARGFGFKDYQDIAIGLCNGEL